MEIGRAGIIVTGLVAIALAVGGFIVLGANDNNQESTTSQTSSNRETNPTNTVNTTANQATVTITYNGSQFSPSSITVKGSDRVEIKNSSTKDIQVQSDSHPVHTDNAELNIGLIEPGKTKIITLTRTGSWSYHNHLDPSQTSTIVVQ